MTKILVQIFLLLLTSLLLKSNISNAKYLTAVNSLNNSIQDNLIDSGPIVGAVTENSAVFIVKPVKPSEIKFQISEDSAFSNSFYSEEIRSD